MNITYEKLPARRWERPGSRHYAVLLDGEKIGEVHRERMSHYKKTSRGIRYGHTSSWQWRVSGISRLEFDTRKAAVERLLRKMEVSP